MSERRRHSPWVIAVFVGVFVLARVPVAQEKLQVSAPDQAVLRLGDSARVSISIEGRTANPRTFQLPKVDGMQLDVSAPSRNSSFVYDGRTATERVSVEYQLDLRPLREGTFVVPSFSIWTGTVEQFTPAIRIEAKRDVQGEQLGFIDVSVEPKSVYVHEPVRIKVDFGVQQSVRLVTGRASNGQPYFDIEVKADWLDKAPFGEPIELPPQRRDQQLIVQGNQAVPVGYESEFPRAGQQWQHFSFERAVLPTRVGSYELLAPVLRYQVLRRDGRLDGFGQRRGLSENYYAKGQPIRIEVKPIPEAGRPTPFYGAVGRALTIVAALDRDTVKQGSSVKLTLTVRGQGNLEFLRLPTIDSLPGFHKLGEAEAQRSADKVVVTYDLTPLSTDVHEVPSIGWNYFDTTPGVEKFVELATKPLSLVVSPMTAVEALAPLPGAATKAVTPGVDDIFDLPAFDGEPRRALTAPAFFGWLAVFGPWLLALLGLAGFRRWRRAAADVDGQRARGALRRCRAALDRGDDPLDALANYLADRLSVPAAAVITADLQQRLSTAGLDDAMAAECARCIEQGTAARYGAGDGLTAAAVRELTARLEGARLGSRCWLPMLWLPLLAGGLAGEVRAQQAGPAEAVASYRALDYQHAEADFAALYERTSDRRYLQARGNCFFRLGDLPRALWAYESARLGMPRDRELLANIDLVRQRLQLDVGPEGFVAELARLRAGLTPHESLLWCALGMSLGAACFVFGWRRIGWRWVGGLVLVPTLWLSVDVLGLSPAPARAVVLQKVALVAEPRADLAAIATLQPGVNVVVLGGEQGSFVRVAVGERSGYLPRDQVAIVQ